MFIVDSIVFICFWGIPGTNKPETVYFLKPFYYVWAPHSSKVYVPMKNLS